MKITVFTSNQPRHVALINALASCGEVFAVQECTTLFPGIVDDSYRSSPVMQAYFANVVAAERTIFGSVAFSPPSARTLSLKMGDLSALDLSVLSEALRADCFVVFGASWIKGKLADALIERGAINIHMGVSPYYRGSSCNFWAMYDGNPDLVGATIHRLSKGLDSGDMLFHALPKRRAIGAFELGMDAVRAAHESLVAKIRDGSIQSMPAVVQDRKHEIRYTRGADFTDAVADEYLGRGLTAADVGKMLTSPQKYQFLDPVFI